MHLNSGIDSVPIATTHAHSNCVETPIKANDYLSYENDFDDFFSGLGDNYLLPVSLTDTSSTDHFTNVYTVSGQYPSSVPRTVAQSTDHFANLLSPYTVSGPPSSSVSQTVAQSTDHFAHPYTVNAQYSSLGLDNLSLTLRQLDDLNVLPWPLTVTTTLPPIISTLSDPITETAESETESAGKAKAVPFINVSETTLVKKFAHICDICNKSCTTKGGFKKHMLIHSTDKPYSYEQCNKKFVSLNPLKGHKSFKQQSQRFSHSKVHEYERPYGCNICPKAFKFKSILKQHMEIHVKNRTLHTCDQCGKNFIQLKNFKNHIDKHTPYKNVILKPESKKSP